MPEQNEKNFSSFLLETMKMQGVSFEKLAQVTGVSDRFLELLIGEEFDKLPAAPYVHGYIIKIADALDLDGEKLWQAYFKEKGVVRHSGLGDTLPQNRFSASPQLRKRLAWGAVIIVVLAIVGYVLFRVERSVGEPTFDVNIGENTVVTQPLFDVKGSADPRDQVILNGAQLYLSADGTFEKKVQLQPGFNTMSFSIKKFLGNEYVITKQVFFESTSTPAGTGSSKGIESTTSTQQ